MIERERIEQQIIAALFMAGCISEDLTPDMFRDKDCRLVFESMQALDIAGTEIDVVSVTADLEKRGRLKSIGGSITVSIISETQTGSIIILAQQLREMLYQERSVGIFQAGLNKARDGLDFTNELESIITLSESMPGGNGSGIEVFTLEQLAELDDSIDWILEGVLPAGRMLILSGTAGSGKSFFALSLALLYSKGVPGKWLDVLDVKPKTGTVAYIDLEMTPQLAKTRALNLGAEINSKFHYITVPCFDVMNGQDYANLKRVLQRIDPELIILDSFADFHVMNENSSGEMVQVLNRIKTIHTSSTKIILHHTRKVSEINGAAERLRGSTAIRGFIDSHIALQYVDGYSAVEFDKPRFGPKHQPFVVSWDMSDGHLQFKQVPGETDLQHLGGMQKLAGLIRQHGGRMQRGDIIQYCNELKQRTIDHYLSIMVTNGTLSKEVLPGRGKPTAYSLNDSGF